MNAPRRLTGFTLVELLVVLAVLTVLGTMAMPLVEVQARRDKEVELRRALWEIRDAIDAYKRAQDAAGTVRGAEQSGYPPSLAALTTGLERRLQDGGVQTQYFLRRVPRDPFADPTLPATLTWGLRSYQSPANKPQPGVDVYDVYSRSSLVGLNSVPLREW